MSCMHSNQCATNSDEHSQQGLLPVHAPRRADSVKLHACKQAPWRCRRRSVHQCSPCDLARIAPLPLPRSAAQRRSQLVHGPPRIPRPPAAGSEAFTIFSPSCLLPGAGSVVRTQVQVIGALAIPCLVVLGSMAFWVVRCAVRGGTGLSAVAGLRAWRAGLQHSSQRGLASGCAMHNGRRASHASAGRRRRARLVSMGPALVRPFLYI